MKPKYKILRGEYSNAFYIYRRRFGFWYRPLIFKKYIHRNDGRGLVDSCPSIEVLYFKVKKNAEREVANLLAGYKPIAERHWRKGKLIKVLRKGGARAKLRR